MPIDTFSGAPLMRRLFGAQVRAASAVCASINALRRHIVDLLNG
jgi:hypothetical protein